MRMKEKSSDQTWHLKNKKTFKSRNEEIFKFLPMPECCLWNKWAARRDKQTWQTQMPSQKPIPNSYSQSQLYSETIWGSLPGCPRGWWCLGCKSGCTPRVVPSSLPGNMEQKPADLQEMSQYTADYRLPRTIWPWHKHFLLGLYCRTSTAENGECRLWIPCGAFPAAEELQENSSHRTWARAPSCLLLA